VFGRKPKLSRESTPPLEPEERVLAWARVADTDDRVVVVTNRGLWLPPSAAAPSDASDAAEAVRVGWHQVHKAAWAEGVLTVTGSDAEAGEGYAVARDTAPITVRLTDPGAVPRRIRERVTASVAHTSVHPLPGGGAVRVVGRRVPGHDGLSWSVRFEDMTADRIDDPGVRAAVDQFVTTAKAAMTPSD
jgi:hypothetical protein